MRKKNFIVGFFLFAGILFPANGFDADSGDIFSNDNQKVSLPAFGGTIDRGTVSQKRTSYPKKKLREGRKPLECTSAKALLSAYVKFALDDDFEGMYLLMTPEFRESYDYSKFYYYMNKDLDVSGGLIGISGVKKLKEQGRYSRWQVTLQYKNKRMKPRTVIVNLKNVRGKWQIQTGVMMPLEAQIN